MKSFAASPHSRPDPGNRRPLEIAVLLAFLIALASSAAYWCYANGCILYYGDAASHLNISRSFIDTRTPGYDQIGTVWLPMLHLICLPFVGNDWLWSSGLAGTLPVACCFVVAGICFYFAAQEAYSSRLAATVVLACFALNPNVLYLAVIPMTELVFLAGLAVILLSVLRFRSTQHKGWIILAIAASWFTCLTRYDGWFLIPFTAAWFSLSARRQKLASFVWFGAAASLAPLYWFAHNWWQTGNMLDFYNGPYSPVAIQGGHWYPGLHDWIAAVHYYAKAGELCSGAVLIVLGVAGALCAWARKVVQASLFLLLTPLFYVWSMHSSGGSPIFLPSLWPHSYYNSRYGIAVVLLCAFSSGAVVLALPAAWRKWAALAIPLLAVTPWLLQPAPENWICWKESQVNSIDRRAWTDAAAKFLESHYRKGQGILSSAGDVTGIYCRARIHLSETLNISNGPLWFLATTRPDLFHPSVWMVAQQGDSLSRALGKRAPLAYNNVDVISTSKDSPPLDIARRNQP